MTNDTKKLKTNTSQKRRQEKQAADAKGKAESRENSEFVQLYPNAYTKLNVLITHQPGVAKFLLFLSQSIGGSGVFIATQAAIGQVLKCSVKTVQRHSQALENMNSLVRIPLQGGVYAYALNPEEFWRGYDSMKQASPFYTGTLVRKRDTYRNMIDRTVPVLLQPSSDRIDDIELDSVLE